MRNHPVVGAFFLLSAAALFLLGAFASDAPDLLRQAPVPPEIVVPFVTWQLAGWCTMFGIFFLRPRTRRGFGRRVPSRT